MGKKYCPRMSNKAAQRAAMKDIIREEGKYLVSRQKQILLAISLVQIVPLNL